jgi:beta-glucosidase
MFDPDEQVPYAHIPITVNDCAAHRALALEVARQSLVLLKNEGDCLPLNKNLKSIAVIGPNAADELVLRANYYGTPSHTTTILDGIRAAASPKTEVGYARGCAILDDDRSGFDEAVALARRSEVTVMVIGLSQQVEGEEGQEEGNPPGIHSTGDRTEIELPGVQEELLEAVTATGTIVVVVLVNGSAVAINWAAKHVPAILEAWYPGQAGGQAVAEVLFGSVNPAGRLPVTFYRGAEQLPPFEDYRMAGRTYRYFDSRQALFPFGFGLSYTRFVYRDLQVTPDQIHMGEGLALSVEVENVGERDGDEVVQLYVQDVAASFPTPRLALQGFARIHLSKGEQRRVSFTLQPDQLALVDDKGQWIIEPGQFRVWVGGHQPDLGAHGSREGILEGSFTVV